MVNSFQITDVVTRYTLLVHVLKLVVAVTFSGGPRGCPGKHLAVGIMKLALAQIVQQYTLEEVPAEDLAVPKFVEWRVNGIPVRLHRRPRASM